MLAGFSKTPLAVIRGKLIALPHDGLLSLVRCFWRFHRRVLKRNALGVGFRHSTFHPTVQPKPMFWLSVASRMEARFWGATPEVIWIVGCPHGRGTRLSFPVEAADGLISGSATDLNEDFLALADAHGVRVWLQLEPSFSDVEKVIRLVLDQYGHHSCVIGVGVDIEWYRNSGRNSGEAVTDDACRRWVRQVRSYNPKYRLFLKHWLIGKMPKTERDGILFVDDGQAFRSMKEMTHEFRVWSRFFSNAEVAFQIGYPSDRRWWSLLQDPPREIGNRIFFFSPNAVAVFWVDFTVMELFPLIRAEHGNPP